KLVRNLAGTLRIGHIATNVPIPSSCVVRSHQKNPVDRRAGKNVSLGVMNDRSLLTRQNLLRPATDHGALARTLVADDENVGGFRNGRELDMRRQPERIRLRCSAHGNGLAQRGPSLSPE